MNRRRSLHALVAVAVLAVAVAGCGTLASTRSRVDAAHTLHNRTCINALSYLRTGEGQSRVSAENRILVADACTVGTMTFLEVQDQLDACEAQETQGGICDKALLAVDVSFGAVDTILAIASGTGGTR